MKHLFIFGILFLGLLSFSGCKKNEFPEIETEYAMGQRRGGGIVVYIDESKQHGLICSTSDLGDGETWADAIELCNEHTGSGYTSYHDWRLPTVTELQNIYAATDGESYVDFSGFYWTSTEANSTQITVVSMNTGSTYPRNKTSMSTNVRAVRSF